MNAVQERVLLREQEARGEEVLRRRDDRLAVLRRDLEKHRERVNKTLLDFI